MRKIRCITPRTDSPNYAIITFFIYTEKAVPSLTQEKAQPFLHL